MGSGPRPGAQVLDDSLMSSSSTFQARSSSLVVTMLAEHGRKEEMTMNIGALIRVFESEPATEPVPETLDVRAPVVSTSVDEEVAVPAER